MHCFLSLGFCFLLGKKEEVGLNDFSVGLCLTLDANAEYLLGATIDALPSCLIHPSVLMLATMLNLCGVLALKSVLVHAC